MPNVLPKIAALRAYAHAHEQALDIMVDGGINFETAVLCAQQGANQFVVGSFMFKHDDMGQTVLTLRTTCSAAGCH